MAELADAIDLGSISKEWGFKSLYPHQKECKSKQSVYTLFFIKKPKVSPLTFLIFTIPFFIG